MSNLNLTVCHVGMTEKGHTLEVGQIVKYLGHLIGGMVKIGINAGEHTMIDVAHPECFEELKLKRTK